MLLFADSVVTSTKREGQLWVSSSLDAAKRIVLHTSLSPEEATFTVPRNSNDILNDRMEKFDSKLDHNIEETRRVDRILAGLEPKIDGHTEQLQKLDRLLDSLRNLVEDRTSASRTVTWAQLGALILFVLVPIGGAAGTFFYGYVMPQKIESVAASSMALNTKVLATFDEKIRPITEDFKTVNTKIDAVDNRLEAFIELSRPSITRPRVVSAIRKKTSVNQPRLREALPQARNLIALVRDFNLPLQRQDYHTISQDLKEHYAVADPSLTPEVWSTLVDLANARSVTDSDVPALEMARAKESGSLVEGSVDLSTEEKWTDTIFYNCEIRISNPDRPIQLEGVRFINCKFVGSAENPTTKDLFTAFLESTEQNISATLGPRGEVEGIAITPPKRRENKAR